MSLSTLAIKITKCKQVSYFIDSILFQVFLKDLNIFMTATVIFLKSDILNILAKV